MKQFLVSFACLMSVTAGTLWCVRVHAAEPDALWLDPRCAPLEATKLGPFLQNDDGSLLVVDKNILRTSKDGGKTWSEGGAEIDPGLNMIPNGHVAQLLRTKSGVLVITFLDFSRKSFHWNNERNVPEPDCLLEMFSIRSADGGKTWTDKQRLLDGYNADFMGLIQLKNGRLVASMEHLAPELSRWLACSFVSDDDGKTWTRSNWIDLGGRGNHDGALEPTVVELNDGRVMMLIRTNLDFFWTAYSSDQGSNWRVLQPTTIEASSAPAWLTRLRSGRLMMVWNPLHPEGKDWPRRESKSMYERPASWYREELCVAFSDDDAKSWTKPVVVARRPGKSLSYPYVFERAPGEVWVATFYGEPHIGFKINEKDFVGATK